MQNIIMYAVADSTLGIVRDYANARGMQAPIFTRGFSATLKLRLFGDIDVADPYPVSLFSGISSWQCVWDVDYNQETGPVLVADNAEIYVHSVTETINSSSYTFTEVVIPISDMNTEELATLIGNNEVVSNLNMELVGFDGDANEVFGLQIKGFSARNRIYYGGTPTPIEEDYLTASQVRALVAAGCDLQYSADGSSWHSTQATTDLYARFRSSSSASAVWSNAITLPQGVDGVTPHIDSTSKHWIIGTTDTGIVAQGQNGNDGVTPHIDSTSKHWIIGTTDTGIVAQGQDGDDGVTPHIDSTSKHWIIGTTDTGIVAQGQNGNDGVTPHIDSTSKHWIIGTTDTGILAQGTDGTDGVRGSRFNYGTSITGTSTTPTAYATGISDSLAGDMYINTSTGNAYQCTLGGNASTALWKYLFCMEGSGGSGSGITSVSLNGEMITPSSGAVDVTALAIAKSMPSASTSGQDFILYLGATDASNTKGHLYEKTVNDSTITLQSQWYVSSPINLEKNSATEYAYGYRSLTYNSTSNVWVLEDDTPIGYVLVSPECTSSTPPWTFSGQVWEAYDGTSEDIGSRYQEGQADEVVTITVPMSWTDLGSII